MSESPIRLRRTWRPHSQRSGCLVGFISGLAVASVAGIFGLVIDAYKECISEETEIRQNYYTLGLEIFGREGNIFSNIGQAKSVDDLRQRLEKPYYVNSQYKDKTLIELNTNYVLNNDQIRFEETAPEEGAELKDHSAELNKLPNSAKFNIVMSGIAPPNLQDSELKDLLVYAWYVEGAHKYLLLNPMRTQFEESCTPKTVLYRKLGLKRLIVHAILGTFLDTEKRLRMEQLKRQSE
jgi:hypothetical protein